MAVVAPMVCCSSPPIRGDTPVGVVNSCFDDSSDGGDCCMYRDDDNEAVVVGGGR